MNAVTIDLDSAALFLDFDGTLAPLENRPDAVAPDARRNSIICRMASRLNGGLAIISGRTLNDVDRILGGTVTCVGASHGLQRRTARLEVYSPEPHEQLYEVAAAARGLAVAAPGIIVEEKTHSIALHYRRAPELEAEVQHFGHRWAEALGLRLQSGLMVVELLTPGSDKGDAVRAFMPEDPFRNRIPVFIGDDLADEEGFAAARAAGGAGIVVGDRPSAQAAARLRDVDDVLNWLEAGLESGRLLLRPN